MRGLKKELGDSLWYIAVIADDFDVSLEDVAKINIAKLADRQKKGSNWRKRRWSLNCRPGRRVPVRQVPHTNCRSQRDSW